MAFAYRAAMQRTYAGVAAALTAAACTPGAKEHEGHPEDAEVSALFESAYEEVNDGKLDFHECSGVSVPDRPGFDKRVALTFDDGPNLATTPDVLSVLRRHEVPATFFVNGQQIDSPEAEDLVAEMAADSRFRVGNHGWTHRQMSRLSAGEVAREIDDTAEVIERLGGEGRYFRFPYGSSTCSTADAVRSRGSEVTGWHVDSADWCFSGGNPGVCPEATFAHVDDDLRRDMVGYTLRKIRENEGGIVLLHDIHRYTADNLERLILKLDSEGYSFVDLGAGDVFPQLNESFVDPDPRDPDGGDDDAGGDDDRREDEEGEDEGGDEDVSASVVDTGGAGLRLRDAPHTDAEILTVMPEGASVIVIEGPEDRWYRVQYGSAEGWAHGAYLAF